MNEMEFNLFQYCIHLVLITNFFLKMKINYLQINFTMNINAKKFTFKVIMKSLLSYKKITVSSIAKQGVDVVHLMNMQHL